jgi:hypothetical protein
VLDCFRRIIYWRANLNRRLHWKWWVQTETITGRRLLHIVLLRVHLILSIKVLNNTWRIINLLCKLCCNLYNAVCFIDISVLLHWVNRKWEWRFHSENALRCYDYKTIVCVPDAHGKWTRNSAKSSHV